MNYSQERDEFIAIATREGIDVDTARALLRYATTLHRLAELACSSEAADRDRIKCPRKYQTADGCLCRDGGNFDEAAGTHGDIPRIALRERQAELRVRKLAQAVKCEPIFSGDPRGCVLKLKVPSGHSNSWGGEGICVPAGPSRIRR